MITLVYVTSDEIGEPIVDDKQLAQLAGAMRAETLLTVVAKLSLGEPPTFLDVDDMRKYQLEAADAFCAAPLAAKVRSFVERGPGYKFVHEEQLLLIAKLGCLYGAAGPAAQVDPDLVGRILLGANDALHRDETAWELRAGSTDTQALMVGLALRRLGMLRDEQDRYLIGRYYDLLATRGRSVKQSRKQMDFDAAFAAQTGGMTIEEYLGFALLYYAGIKQDMSLQDASDELHMWESRVSDAAILRRCEELFSNDIRGFRDAFQKRPAILHSSFRPIQTWPLLRTEGDRKIPVSVPFMLDKISMGPYWLLHTYYRRTDSKNGVVNYQSFVGELFQDYASDLLTRTFSNATAEQPRFFDEQSIIDASTERLGLRPCDGVVVEGTAIVPLEMGVTGLAVEAMVTADSATFAKEVNKLIEKVQRQLQTVIKDMASGKWTIPGVQRESVKDVYPVLVLLHPFPQTSATMGPIQRALPDQHLDFGAGHPDTHVYQIQILTAEELEMLEVFIRDEGYSFVDLLSRKLGEAPDTNMKTWLLTVVKTHDPLNQYMKRLTDHALGEANRARERYLPK